MNQWDVLDMKSGEEVRSLRSFCFSNCCPIQSKRYPSVRKLNHCLVGYSKVSCKKGPLIGREKIKEDKRDWF